MSTKNLKLIKEILETEFVAEIERGDAAVRMDSDDNDGLAFYVTLDIAGEEYYFGHGLPEDMSEEEIVMYLHGRIKENNL